MNFGMKAFLLYRQREWVNTGRYYDYKSIVQDLGLNTLFTAAAKDMEQEDGRVKLVQEADTFILDTMKQVMMVPLATEEEICYRQDVLRDCFEDEALIGEVYELSAKTLQKWDKLGRRVSTTGGDRSSARNLVTEIGRVCRAEKKAGGGIFCGHGEESEADSGQCSFLCQ